MTLYKEIERSFPRIGGFFTEAALRQFAAAPPGELDRFNFGLGTMIRLKLLPPKGALYKCFVKEGYADRDEMAMEVLREFHKYLLREHQSGQQAVRPANPCRPAERHNTR